MARIVSPVEMIKRITWVNPQSGKPFRAQRIVTVRDGHRRVTVAHLGGDRFWCPDIERSAVYLPGRWPWVMPVLKALVAMDLLSQAEVDRHMAEVDKWVKADQLKADRYTLEQLKKKYGPSLRGLRAQSKK